MITEQTIKEIAQLTSQLPLDQAISSGLRNRFPEIHFSYCLDDDVINGRPVISTPDFNLYLVDARDHCLTLTTNHEVATGVLVAQVFLDE